MPARKNKPGKFGTETGTHLVAVSDRKRRLALEERSLVDKFIAWEHENPREMHYVGWPDMDAAKRLEKNGYLQEGHATGCFYITEAFRRTFVWSAP